MANSLDTSFEVRQMLELVARSIVAEPARVTVEAEISQERTLIRLQVAPGDLPRINGPSGLIRSSLGHLLGDLGLKHKRVYALEITAEGA